MELNKFVHNIAMKAEVNIEYDIVLLISEFFENNNWFNNPPKLLDDTYYLTEEQEEQYKERLILFLNSLNNTKEENYILLKDMFINKFPNTSKYITKFFDEIGTDEESKFYIVSFLLHETEKDLFLYSDEEIAALINKIIIDLTKKDG